MSQKNGTILTSNQLHSKEKNKQQKTAYTQNESRFTSRRYYSWRHFIRTEAEITASDKLRKIWNTETGFQWLFTQKNTVLFAHAHHATSGLRTDEPKQTYNINWNISSRFYLHIITYDNIDICSRQGSVHLCVHMVLCVYFLCVYFYNCLSEEYKQV